MHTKPLALIGHTRVSAVLACLVVAASSCAVRKKTTVVAPPALAPAMEATPGELARRLNARDGEVRTLVATVDFETTAGSKYAGVIKKYHDVKGFILVKKPAFIRVIGQAPVVRTGIFDMVSDGKTFSLSIPPKHKFVTGPNTLTRPVKNPLENMRPQHILEALLPPPIEPNRDRYSDVETEEQGRKYYVLTVWKPTNTGQQFLRRKIWFDRSDLAAARFELYDESGALVEDVRYSRYQDFQGVGYPSKIEITRPIDDYALALTIKKATFNQEISSDKFRLKRLPGEELVDWGAASKGEGKHGE